MKKQSKTLVSLVLCFLSFQFSAFAQISGASVVCSGQTVTYSSQSSASTHQWSVSGAKSFSQSSGSVTVEWGVGGNGAVNLNTFDQNNNPTGSYSKSVSINAKPNPVIISGFDTDCFQTQDGQDSCFYACQDQKITYSSPFVAGSTYQWETIGNGTITTISPNEIEVVWADLGMQYIKLTVSNASGCNNTYEKCVRVFASPTAKIKASPQDTSHLTVCQGSELYLEDQSSGAISRRWDFGDGTASDQINVTHQYTQAGTYEIILTAYNNCYCFDSDTITVTVEAKQGPEIICPGIVCKTDTMSYSTPSSCSAFNWSATNGTILGSDSANTIEVVWNDHPGFLELAGTNCNNVCQVPTKQRIPIIADSIPITGDTIVCKGNTYVYSIAPLPGSDYYWTVPSSLGTIVENNGYSITVEIAQNISPGATIDLSYHNPILDCGGTTSLDVATKHQINFSIPSEYCFNDTVDWLIDYPVDWEIVDTSGSSVYSTTNTSEIHLIMSNLGSGDYILHLGKRDNYCADLSLSFTVLDTVPQPDTIYGESVICSASAYSYQVDPKTGYRIEWLVEGGTPTTGTGTNFTVNWNGTPPYSLKAAYRELESPNCISSYTEKNISSLNNASPTIIANDSACGGDSALVKLNVIPDNVSWTVIPNDAASILGDRFSHEILVQFSAAATQQVTLRAVGTVCGNNFVVTKNIDIQSFSTPTITFSNPSPCTGMDVSFISSARNPQWEIDGEVYTETTPTLSFSEAKTVKTKLTVQYTGPNGCIIEKVAIKNLTVKAGPTAKMAVIDSNSTFCKDTLSPITMSAVLQGGGNYSYQWLKNGVFYSSSTSITTPQVGAHGTYVLQVTSPNGCVSTSTPYAIVCSGDDPQGCENNVDGTNIQVSSVQVSQNSCNEYYVSNVVVNGATFKSISLSRPIVPTNNYGPYGLGFILEAGTRILEFNGVVSSGGVDYCFSYKLTHTVPFVLDFDIVKQPCIGVNNQRYQLINTTTFASSPPNHNWGVGSGTYVNSSATSFSPTVEFAAGNHTISLSAGGCTVSKDIAVGTVPVAGFTSDAPSCQQEIVNFTNTSTGNFVEYKWDFDGKVLFNDNPSVTFEDGSGNYDQTYFPEAKLYSLDNDGCRDTIGQILTIHGNDLNTSLFMPNSGPICEGDSVLISPAVGFSPSNTPVSYTWSNQETTASIQAKQTGNYQLSITDNVGCRFVTDQVNLEVNSAPNPTIIGKQTFCADEDVKLSVLNHPSYGLNWYLDGNSVSNTTSEFEASLPTGNYSVSINAVNSTTGCPSINPPHPVTVLAQVPAPVISSNASSPVCEGSPIQLSASPASSSYYWNTGQTAASITQSLAGDYTAYHTDPSGCQSQSTYSINPQPDLSNFMKGCYCLPFFDTPNLPGIPNMASYQWIKNDTAVPAPNGQLQDLPAFTGSFELVAVTDSGCVDTARYMDISVGGCEDCNLSLSDFDFQCSGSSNDSVFYDFSLISDLQSSSNGNYGINLQLELNGQAAHIIQNQPTSIASGSNTVSGSFVLVGSSTGDSLCMKVVASNPGVNCSATICTSIPPLACQVTPDFTYTANPYTCEVQLEADAQFGACTSEDSVIYSWTITQNGQTITGTGSTFSLDSLSAGNANVCMQMEVFNAGDSSFCVIDTCRIIEVPDCNCYNNCSNIAIASTEFVRFIQQNDSCILEFKIIINNPSSAAILVNHLKSQDGTVLSVSSTFSAPGTPAFLVRYYPPQPWEGGTKCFDLFLNNDGIDCCQSFCVDLPKCSCDLNLKKLHLDCSGAGSPQGYYDFKLEVNLVGSNGFDYDISQLKAMLGGNAVTIVSYSPTTVQNGNQIIVGKVDLSGASGSEVCFEMTTSLGGIECRDKVCSPLPRVPCNLEPSFESNFNRENCTLTLTNTSTASHCVEVDSSAISWSVDYQGTTYTATGQEVKFTNMSDAEVDVCMTVSAKDFTGNVICTETYCNTLELEPCQCENHCDNIEADAASFLNFVSAGDSCILRYEFSIINNSSSGFNINTIVSASGKVLNVNLISTQNGVSTYAVDFLPNAPWNGGNVCFDVFLGLSDGSICCLEFCVELPKCGCDLELSEMEIDCTGPNGNRGDFKFSFLANLGGSPGFVYNTQLTATLNGVPVSVNSYQPNNLVNGSQLIEGLITLSQGQPGDILCLTLTASLGGQSCTATICDTLPEADCEITPSLSWYFDHTTCELVLSDNSNINSCTYLQNLSWTVEQTGSPVTYTGSTVRVGNLSPGVANVCLNLLGLNYTGNQDCHPDSCLYIPIPECDPDGGGFEPGFERIKQSEESTAEMEVYPNPTKSKLFIEWKQLLNKQVSLKLYDYQSKLVQTQERKVEESPIELNLEGLVEGVYILEVQWDGQLSKRKVVLLK